MNAQVTYDDDMNAYVWRNSAGLLHRLDGPAIEYDDGAKAWYQNGKRHREDGPAVEYASGLNAWYQHDRLHRVDGPAFETTDGYKEWYIDGEDLTEEEFNERTKPAEKTIVLDGVTYRLVKV